jgi:hypothetical protein
VLKFPVLCVLPQDAKAAEKFTWDLERAQGWDRVWRRRQFSQLPDCLALPIAKQYRENWESIGEQGANLYLLNTVERLACLAIHPRTSDDEVIGLSKRIAESCRDVLRMNGNRPQTAEWLLRICNRYEIYPPPELSRYGNRNGSVTDKVTVTEASGSEFSASVLGRGTIARITDDTWWRRKLRVVHGRILEAEAIRLHQVHRYAGCFVSEATFKRYQQQRKRNKRVLSRLVAENEAGDSLPLSELVEHSLANPTNRRSELMVRIYGFEQLAKEFGHVAILLTVTCPSRMHSHLGKSGFPNRSFDTAITPRVAQSYLTTLGSRIRAKWQRLGLRPYGFRITEAHHDGTPHWHILLFIAPDQQQSMVDVVRSYALADSPEEPGAAEHRFRVEKIDPNKGSATGYVAKYISKNIDGFGMSESDDKDVQSTMAQRASAWSSTWGIRQFQQIGGPAVGLWREFRRAVHLTMSTDLVGELAGAANKGSWATFVRLLGGPQQSRKSLPISLEKYNDLRPGRYGEAVGLRIAGIRQGNVVFSTRFHTWSIKNKVADRNCTQAVPVVGTFCEKGAAIIGFPPWSSVNNCIT